MRPTTKVQGDQELARAFDRMADRLDQAPDVALRAAEPVLAAARALVPVRSGALLASLAIVPADSMTAGGAGAAVTAGGPDVPYAGVIEYGWSARGIDAQPYLEPALAGQAPDVLAVYDGWIGELVDRFDREAP